MNSTRKYAFTLVELLVVIAILFTLFGLMVPRHGNQSREIARQITCRNNLKQLQMALTNREISQKNFPGYINSVGPINGNQTRASWILKILPYLEQAPLANRWEQGEYAYARINFLNCPSDPPEQLDTPELSYVANAGYLANSNGVENQANGVFFDKTRTAEGASGPQDARDLVNSSKITMTLANIKDGMSRTLLLSENLHALHWGYTTDDEQQNVQDQKFHFGFCWEQPAVVTKAIETNSPEQARRINGLDNPKAPTSFREISPNKGFPSSNHPGGVMVAFVGGNVQFLSEDIDPLVYAQLMTSNSKKSDLVDSAGKPDKELRQPANDY